MPEYTFDGLSPDDFERLVRDLLQEELALTLESFKTGKDAGIDLRYTTSVPKNTVARLRLKIRPSLMNADIIVQAKKYQTHAWSKLESVIVGSEAPKVQALAPKRYILATSVGLSPGNKGTLQAALAPYCRGPGDIFGANDLNNLIGKFSIVEKRHFKLWLTSTTVLEKVLHSKIYNFSDWTIEKIRQDFCRYVQTKATARALELLEREHHCIIVGLPGIGKTTLAKMLLAQYIEKGFEVVALSKDAGEAWSIQASRHSEGAAKRVFYFDDFLGQTALEIKFEKNEEKRLLEFIELVRHRPNLRFILTTREYILSQAVRRYERLSEAMADLAKCTVELKDLTPSTRALILYNHLYFSDLPQDKVYALLDAGAHHTIVQHRNFNPRVIEQLCRAKSFSKDSPSKYVEKVLRALDVPEEIWAHPFRNQISQGSRVVLLALASCGGRIQLAILRKAATELGKELGAPDLSLEFVKSLEELDGNFVRTIEGIDFGGSEIGTVVFAEFHNPSVRDYLNIELARDLPVLTQVFSSSIEFTQISYLLRAVDENDNFLYRESILRSLGEFSLRKILSMTDSNEIVIFGAGATLYADIDKNRVKRLQLALEVAKALNDPDALQIYYQFLSDLSRDEKKIQSTLTSAFEYEALGGFVENVLGDSEIVEDTKVRFREASRELILGQSERIHDVDGCAALAHVIDGARGVLHDEDLEGVIDRVADAVDQYVKRVAKSEYSADGLQEQLNRAEEVEEILGLDLSDAKRKLGMAIKRAEEAEQAGDDEEPEHGMLDRAARDTEEPVDIEGLFQGLRGG